MTGGPETRTPGEPLPALRATDWIRTARLEPQATPHREFGFPSQVPVLGEGAAVVTTARHRSRVQPHLTSATRTAGE